MSIYTSVEIHQQCVENETETSAFQQTSFFKVKYNMPEFPFPVNSLHTF